MALIARALRKLKNGAPCFSERLEFNSPQLQQRCLSWIVRQKTWNGTESLVVTEEKNRAHYVRESSFPSFHLWSRSGHRLTFLESIRKQLSATFLPVGFPNKSCVGEGYLQYVGWQAVHHTMGAANGVLASTFLLYAVGLENGAIPTAGALSWVLKDGLGQLGTLLFGRAMAHNFDVASRTWYVAASIKLNVAMALEITTFAFPHYFIALGALANAIKGLAWMAGGSSRSAFNVAFALDRNIADITAKATSQTICTSLAGTLIGMGAASLVGQSLPAAAACFSSFAAFHIWTAIKSARVVQLATLNPSRLTMLAEMFVNQRIVDGDRPPCRLSTSQHSTPTVLPSPADLAKVDDIIPTRWQITFKQSLKSLVQSWKMHSKLSIAHFLSVYRCKRHILFYANKRIHIILHEAASLRDCMVAVLQAVVWQQKVLSASDPVLWQDTSIAKSSLIQAEAMHEDFESALKAAGWDANGMVLEGERHRAVW
jgi:hypothetical protein